MDASPPQSSPMPSKALLSPRPNSHIAHTYLWSDKGGERGESHPHSPSSLSKRFLSRKGKGEGAGDHSRTEKSRQGNLGSHSASAGPPDHTDILLSVRSLTCCPLATRPLGPGRQLPSLGHRDPTRNLLSGRAWNRPPFIKVRRGPTGNTRSSMTRYCSHMPTLTRIGNKAVPTTACGRRNLCHTMRILRERGTRVAEQPSGPTATNWPGQCTPVRTWHTPVPWATPRAPPPRGTPNPAFAGHPLGSPSMGLCAGNLAGRQPPALAFSLGARQRLWPWNHYWLALHGQHHHSLQPLSLRLVGSQG